MLRIFQYPNEDTYSRVEVWVGKGTGRAPIASMSICPSKVRAVAKEFGKTMKVEVITDLGHEQKREIFQPENE